MALMVYDTLRGRKTEFEPVREGTVGIYFCGMTVQDRPHIGHMLAFVAGDMIRRYLIYKGYAVTYVQNFTDVDDKIIDRARREGVDFRVIAERNIAEYFKYAAELNIMPADIYPKATEHIGDIIALVERLVERGYAYAAGGDVYFRVRRFEDYGKLSKRRVDELQAGARIEVGERKEDPLDFTLWKAAKEDEPAWESPWGRGRPGWHIECSVMSMKYLGETLDMHGGGQDLVFPHHENEIAQSEAATGKPFVNYWMHNGLLNLRGEKMSKSTGHFFSIEEVNREFSGEVIRFYLLSTHFRSRSEFSRERLREAEAGFERIRNLCIFLDEARSGDAWSAADAGRGEPSSGGGEGSPLKAEFGKLRDLVDEVRRDFIGAMDDDFNSAEAIGHLFRLVREINRVRGEGEAAFRRNRETIESIAEAVAMFDAVLGLFKEGPPRAGHEIPADVLQLVEEREEARRRKEWTRADSLRDAIEARGFILEDHSGGTAVKPKR